MRSPHAVASHVVLESRLHARIGCEPGERSQVGVVAVFEDAVVGGVDVFGAAEVGGETGVGGQFGVECTDYAVVEKLVCECAGEGGGGVGVWVGFVDDGHAGEVFEYATWVVREILSVLVANLRWFLAL